MRNARSLAVAAVLVLPAACATGRQQLKPFGRVQALDLDSLPGRVPTYYSPGARTRAASLQKMIDEALRYYAERLRVAPRLALAVLNQDHWRAVREVPYGVPWVSAVPRVTVLPADLEQSVIVAGFRATRDQASMATRQALEAAGVPFEAAPYRLNDFIGYHEVGHVVVESSGVSQTQHWFNEMLATFAAYAFLRERHPSSASAFDALMQLNVTTIRPSFRSLDQFQRSYEAMPEDTYGWYQAMFHARARQVFDTEGLDFLNRLRAAGIKAGVRYSSAAELLERLDKVVPGFKQWAATVERHTSLRPE
jgi:hypothetical protein